MATVDRDQSKNTRQVFLYFGPMTLLVYLVMPTATCWILQPRSC
jgi:hypothetical protein